MQDQDGKKAPTGKKQPPGKMAAKAAAKPAPAPRARAATKPANKPAGQEGAKPGASRGGPSGYQAQHQAQSPANKPNHAQGATLLNNRPEREQGQPAGQDFRKEKPRAPGTFLVQGQPFATLAEVHDWLLATQPSDPQIVIQATPGSQVDVSAQTLWHYYKPDQKIILDGQGAAVTGLQNGRPSMGYFLSYRPAIGQQNTAQTPAAANLEVRNLSIRGFEAGGIEISPQVQPGKQNEWDGGLQAFVQGAMIDNVNFQDLGNAKSARKDRVWNNLRFGAAGVMMRGVQDSTVQNCSFDSLTNGEMTFNNTDDKGQATSESKSGNHLFHAVYMRDSSSNNLVSNNAMSNIGGDAVRVSNGSNHNTIAGNHAHNAGQHGLVSNWFNSARGEKDSAGTMVRDNTLGKTYADSTGKGNGKGHPKDKAKGAQLAAYTRKESKGKQGAVTNTAT